MSAKIITTIWPELADQLPEIVKALAPQPGRQSLPHRLHQPQPPRYSSR